MGFQALLILRESGEYVIIAPTYMGFNPAYKYRFIDFQNYWLKADSMWLKQIPGEYVHMRDGTYVSWSVSVSLLLNLFS